MAVGPSPGIGRLMKENGIKIRRNKKFKATTDSNHSFQHRAEPAEPGLPCGSPQPEMGGRHQLCLDTRRLALSGCHLRSAFSRRVIGWAVSNRMKRDLAIRALNMAIALRRPTQGLYPSYRSRQPILFARLSEDPMRQHGFRASDERNLGIATTMRPSKPSSRRSRLSCCGSGLGLTASGGAELAIFEYINGFYNPRRRHSALGWKSPLAFERKAA